MFKSTIHLWLIIPFLLFQLIAAAQIPSAKDKSKLLKKAKEEVKAAPATNSPAEKPTTTAPASKPVAPTKERENASTQDSHSDNDEKEKEQPLQRSRDKSVAPVELDFDSEPLPPVISWGSLLVDGSTYFNVSNGEFKLKSALIAFLPKKTKSGDNAEYVQLYTGDKSATLLRMQLVDMATNSILETFGYTAKPYILPYYEMEMIEGGGYPFSVKLTGGNYELRFFLGDRHFYTFPIQVEMQTNPDPYAPVNKVYFMSGPWVDWSRIEFNSEGNLIYSFYHTFFDTDIKNQAQGNFKKTFTGTIELYQNGKLVAVKDASINGKSRADFEIRSSNGYWTKFDYTLYKFPLDGAKKFYTQSDMKDGNYEIKLAIKDEKGGVEAKKFGFEMKNGKILPAEEADRTRHTDTKTLIDEGRDYHYMKAKQ